MEDLERIVALEEIRRLKHTYCHALDAKDWGLFETLFTEDGAADMREAGPADAPGMVLTEGRPAMMAYVKEAVKDWKTIHHVYAPLIDFTAPDEATGVWQMADRLLVRAGDGWALLMQGYGHYHEVYRKRGGRWQIHRVKLTRHHVEYGPAAG